MSAAHLATEQQGKSTVWARTWASFWHTPIAAKRLAFFRIAIGLGLLTDQLVQYMPFLGYLFGPGGIGAAGLNDRWMATNWRWPVLFFTTDDMFVIAIGFCLWVLAALCLTIGFKTRWAAVASWFLTMCFFARNSNVKNGGDDIIQIALFLLMFVPSANTLSWDSRRALSRGQPLASRILPWGVRLLQIQMCMMYTATGLAKLKGGLGGTWLQGTSLHYVFNDIALTRWSYAQFPIPLWLTRPLCYIALLWETLFIVLVAWNRTRRFALWYGVLFHGAIFLSLEVGWFSVYSVALYTVWISDEWLETRWPGWERLLRHRAATFVGWFRPMSS